MAVTSKLELIRGEFSPWLFANESLSISLLSATSYRFARFLWDNINAPRMKTVRVGVVRNGNIT